MDRIEVRHSDTDGVPFGQGSYGSRTFSVEGAVIYQAAQVIKAKALKVGAYMLKASEDDVVFEDGKVSLKNDPAQSKSLQDIASWLWFAWDLPPGVEPGLEATEYFNPSDFNFPFGSHVAIVEIDEQTGASRSRRLRLRGRRRQRRQLAHRRGSDARQRRIRLRAGADGTGRLRRRRATC